jgi:alkanesulfonate monooxygenase SsuD/methylene tetrahydromethanopterin reductase-like flavin-dependent oxidoreductase (luciferase family)
MQLGLKYDLRAPAFGAPAVELYAAAIEQCRWADRLGFDDVRFMEHHGSPDGYCPSPLVVAAAVAAVTERVRIRITALILPLHDPVRIAEDATVVDLISRGRLELLVGGGYMHDEYQMFGRDLADRPRLVEDGIDVLKRAWTGEPFDYQGRTCRVALRPAQDPRPPLVLGGSSNAAARRAARIADGFEPTLSRYVHVYEEECAKLGKPVGSSRPNTSWRFLHLAHDPDAAWDAIGAHCLHEMNSYGA